MNPTLTRTLACSLVAVTTLSALPADAGQRWRDRDYRHHRHNHQQRGMNGGDMLAAGILGLAAGAIIGGIASQPRTVYVDPYPGRYRESHRYDRAPQPVYRAGYEPWSREWFRYCSNRYRSFDPGSSTFMGYDGVRRFCVAN